MNQRASSRFLLSATGLGILAVATFGATRGVAAEIVPPAAPALSTTWQQGEIDEILDERLEAIREMDSAGLWREASRVAGLIGDEFGADFDKTVDARLKAASGSTRETLFLATLRLSGDDVDYALVANSTLPVLRDGDEDLVRAATELLGGIATDIADRDVKGDAADALLARAQDGNASSGVRVSAAVAVNRLGNGGQIAAGRRVLASFLDSSDPGLRAAGALGFAELSAIEDVDGVEDELDRLAQLPGDDGRLARAYLEQLRQTRFHDSSLKRLRDADRDRRRVGSSLPKDLERIETLLDVIQQAHLDGETATRSELLESAMQGMLGSLDRHSSYFPSKAYEKFEQDLEAEYGGIGAYVQNDPEDGLFTITRPIYSGPAYQVGLATDDKIIRIGDWPTVGESTDEIIKRLKGKPGTIAKLYIWRRDMDPQLIDRPTEDMVVEVRRAQINIPSVHKVLMPGDIGLVELQTFSRHAARDIADAITALREETASGELTGLVLDLRNNTGGLLDQAAAVADLFLPKGKVVVKTESRVKESKSFQTENPAFLPADLPLTVLINRFSASASEIVSGALQDHGRAKLIGQRSFGKGSVQSLIRMPNEYDDQYSDENRNRRRDNWERITKDFDGDGEFDYAPRIKLTIERYRLPFGRSIHREFDEEGKITSQGGVPADVEVETRKREPWRLREMRRIQDTRKLRKHVEATFEANREAYEKIAYCDFDNTELYPGFDEVLDSLDTNLTREDVRFLMRIDVRRRVQDTRGNAFPFGDFPEDFQLQAAIEEILAASQREVKDIPEYAATFDDRTKATDLAAAPADLAGELGTDRVARAMTLIKEAETGQLTKQSADELRSILDDLGSEKN